VYEFAASVSVTRKSRSFRPLDDGTQARPKIKTVEPMAIYTGSNAQVFHKFLLVFVPIAVIVFLVTWSFYSFHFLQQELDRFSFQEKEHIEVHTRLLQADLKGIKTDIQMLSKNPDLIDFLQHGRDPHNHAITEFILFSQFKSSYDQIRVLDEKGYELIRINLNGLKPRSVRSEELQNKSHRYYFKDALQLGEGEVYISTLDLNIEHGQIELPHKPMLRIATPIIVGGNKFVLVMNYLAVRFLRNCERGMYQSPMIFLNSGGYNLNGTDESKRWGFLFNDREQATLKYEDPELWKQIVSLRDGQLVSNNGFLHTFNTIFPLEFGFRATDNTRIESSAQSSHERFWVMLSSLSVKQLYESTRLTRNALIALDLCLSLLLAYICWQFSVAKINQQIALEMLELSNRELDARVIQKTNEHKQSVEHSLILERQLEQSAKMELMGTIASSTAHDFNNSLTVIMGNAQLALETDSDIEEMRDALQQILVTGKKASKLTREVLAFSRKKKGDFINTDIAILTKDSLALLGVIAPKGIVLKLSIDDDCGSALIDAAKYSQILMNLVNNAIHAMDNKGELRIVLEPIAVADDNFPEIRPGSYIRLSVVDSGKGMDKETIKQIFNPFFTTKSADEGTGMGLAIIQKIVKEHDAQLRVDSVVGKGTSFEIYFNRQETERKKESAIIAS